MDLLGYGEKDMCFGKILYELKSNIGEDGSLTTRRRTITISGDAGKVLGSSWGMALSFRGGLVEGVRGWRTKKRGEAPNYLVCTRGGVKSGYTSHTNQPCCVPNYPCTRVLCRSPSNAPLPSLLPPTPSENLELCHLPSRTLVNTQQSLKPAGQHHMELACQIVFK